jgi:hypothetical protein
MRNRELDPERDLVLANVQDLRGYEVPDAGVVANIAWSVSSTGQLRDPVVADLSRGLVVDGHHRLQAFKWLGLRTIPCYCVDYRSDEITVRSWLRVTRAPPAAVKAVFCALRTDGVGGDWGVSARVANADIIEGRQCQSALEAALHLDRIASLLAAAGYPVWLEADCRDDLGSDFSVLQVEPTVGKSEILAAVEQRFSYPAQVNRHLIDGRPIKLDVPTSSFMTGAEFARHVTQRVTLPSARSTGTWDQDRYYEETVTVLGRREEPGG